MYASVSAEFIIPALKRGLLPLQTASDFNWPWLQDEAWVESKSEQEALWAAYSALPDIAKAVLSFDAFVAKATPEQIAAGMRVANQKGQQAAGMIMPSQVAALRLLPSVDHIAWPDQQVALTISPKFLKSIAASQIAPVQYGAQAKGKYVGWQQMPTAYASQHEVRWLAPKTACTAHNHRYWLKLSKQALSKIAVQAGSSVSRELAELIKMDQRYRQVQLQQVQFDTKSFSYQLL
ncbi:hypothetical protein [Salinibius halmophilus]|uniref:hypothetical protein n=1 Tax=Salinibius halmophilus TaxID=1853216 RepID=UPI000E66726C|nr:hypothetical protein [Salinibius halmophilus]